MFTEFKKKAGGIFKFVSPKIRDSYYTPVPKEAQVTVGKHMIYFNQTFTEMALKESSQIEMYVDFDNHMILVKPHQGDALKEGLFLIRPLGKAGRTNKAMIINKGINHLLADGNMRKGKYTLDSADEEGYIFKITKPKFPKNV